MSTAAVDQDLRFPIGKFDQASFASRAQNIVTLENLSADLRAAVAGLDDGQLGTEYRPQGWTLSQTVHHIADSHINSFCRFKLALTEDEPPTIRPYYEDRWAELADSRLPIDVSLSIIEGVHMRWTSILRSMTDEDFKREFVHPETGRWTLEKALAMYAWHSRHHTAHITEARNRHGW